MTSADRNNRCVRRPWQVERLVRLLFSSQPGGDREGDFADTPFDFDPACKPDTLLLCSSTVRAIDPAACPATRIRPEATRFFSTNPSSDNKLPDRGRETTDTGSEKERATVNKRA